MSEMVDRVAKAAANAYYGEDCWDSLTEEVFDQWIAVARVAVEAMRNNPDAADAIAILTHSGTWTNTEELWGAGIASLLTIVTNTTKKAHAAQAATTSPLPHRAGFPV